MSLSESYDPKWQFTGSITRVGNVENVDFSNDTVSGQLVFYEDSTNHTISGKLTGQNNKKYEFKDLGYVTEEGKVPTSSGTYIIDDQQQNAEALKKTAYSDIKNLIYSKKIIPIAVSGGMRQSFSVTNEPVTIRINGLKKQGTFTGTQIIDGIPCLDDFSKLKMENINDTTITISDSEKYNLLMGVTFNIAPSSATTDAVIEYLSIDGKWYNPETLEQRTIDIISGKVPSEPKFSEESKSFKESFDVMLTGEWGSDKISYTTDGTDPDLNNAQQGPITITITDTTTIKAIAVRDGISSDVVSVTYTKENQPEVPTSPELTPLEKPTLPPKSEWVSVTAEDTKLINAIFSMSLSESYDPKWQFTGSITRVGNVENVDFSNDTVSGQLVFYEDSTNHTISGKLTGQNNKKYEFKDLGYVTEEGKVPTSSGTYIIDDQQQNAEALKKTAYSDIKNLIYSKKIIPIAVSGGMRQSFSVTNEPVTIRINGLKKQGTFTGTQIIDGIPCLDDFSKLKMENINDTTITISDSEKYNLLMGVTFNIAPSSATTDAVIEYLSIDGKWYNPETLPVFRP